MRVQIENYFRCRDVRWNPKNNIISALYKTFSQTTQHIVKNFLSSRQNN